MCKIETIYGTLISCICVHLFYIKKFCLLLLIVIYVFYLFPVHLSHYFYYPIDEPS